MMKLKKLVDTSRLDGKYACITLDLEDNWDYDEQDLRYRTFEYVSDYVQMINDLGVPVSIFVVGKVLEERPEAVETIRNAIDCDFHLHSYSHDITENADPKQEIQLGKSAFYEYFGREPSGYRAPQGRITGEKIDLLDRAEFDFDASVFPSYRPGVYNNLTAPKEPYYLDTSTDLIEIPFAVHPWTRIPISQSYLKLFGQAYHSLLKYSELPDILVFDSHLQDFYHTPAHEELDEPIRSIHRRNIHNSPKILSKFVQILRDRGYEFVKIDELYEVIA